MATFVLVHGAWHGAWCWDYLVPRLTALGHTVLAPDLAGLGEDQTPLRQATIARWADDIAALVERQAEPVILVGHSRGGIVISEVAERVPDRIALLVYLTAALLVDGQSMMDLFMTRPEPQVGALAEMDHDLGGMTVLDAMIAPTFYSTTSDADIAFAKARLRPEPLTSTTTKVQLTDARFGRVKRVYVECLRDNAITLDLQRAMQAALPCGAVFAIDCDHSPFFSALDELTETLDRIARLE